MRVRRAWLTRRTRVLAAFEFRVDGSRGSGAFGLLCGVVTAATGSVRADVARDATLCSDAKSSFEVVIEACSGVIGEASGCGRDQVCGTGARAEAYFSGRGDYQNAIDDATAAIKLQPDNPDAYVLRASVYLAFNEFDKAIADYSSALERAAQRRGRVGGPGQRLCPVGRQRARDRRLQRGDPPSPRRRRRHLRSRRGVREDEASSSGRGRTTIWRSNCNAIMRASFRRAVSRPTPRASACWRIGRRARGNEGAAEQLAAVLRG